MVRVELTKATTAPGITCPKCKSEKVIWIEVENMGLGFYRCKDCKNEGWG